MLAKRSCVLASSLHPAGKLGIVFLFALVPIASVAEALPRGIFTDHQDVGTVLHAGSVLYDSASHAYTIGIIAKTTLVTWWPSRSQLLVR